MANGNTITSANAILALTISSLYPQPQQIQGFAADDIYDVDNVDPAEVLRGVDGKMSAGFVFKNVVQNIMLQADSASNDFFEQWYYQQQVIADLFYAYGVVKLPSISKSYTMSKGVLSNYKPMPDGKRVLQPRRFTITWESVFSTPTT